MIMSGIRFRRRRPLPDLNLPYIDDHDDDDHQPINLDLVLHPPSVDDHPNLNASPDSNPPMLEDNEMVDSSDDGDDIFESDGDEEDYDEEMVDSSDDYDEEMMDSSDVEGEFSESDGDEEDYDDGTQVILVVDAAEGAALTSGLAAAAAAREVVEGLPSVVVEEEEGEGVVCAVCMEEVAARATAKRLPCSHRYHEGCISRWLASRNTCPLCRHALPTEEDLRRRR